VEVGPLSRGVTSKPLSEPLQPGVRFFHDPLPAPPTASLTISLPMSKTTLSAAIRAYPVPRQQHEQRRSCLFTGGARVDVSHLQKETTDHRPFWLGRIPLRPPRFDNGVYQQFTCVDPTAQPGPLPACSSRTHVRPSRVTHIVQTMRLCQGASHATVARHALPIGYVRSNRRFPAVQYGTRQYRTVEQLLTWLSPRQCLVDMTKRLRDFTLPF
jgi:hypothetical protein